MNWEDWHVILLGLFLIYAGVRHFQVPKFFIKITPPWGPSPEKMNVFIGCVEILLGLAVIVPSTRSLGAWGIILLLILVFPANIYHHQLARKKGKHVTATLIRLPFQFLFMWWAYQYV